MIVYGVTTVVGNLNGEPGWVVSVEITQDVGVVVCVEMLYVELKIAMCCGGRRYI